MNGLVLLVLSAMGLGLLALAGFMWALRSGQYDDVEGAGERILLNDDYP
ncbi:cbb3-type cytochrome oxidase assembly protein CcoS [Devosia sp. SL43]|nr:cbb3-type cytochrome oxidase assembly protein CcoS [Devosia sp. SL43]UJW85563.1 cbb3-type cytochrome oxidase assembly protein CcoS [Devosia sp. SL43]